MEDVSLCVLKSTQSSLPPNQMKMLGGHGCDWALIRCCSPPRKTQEYLFTNRTVVCSGIYLQWKRGLWNLIRGSNKFISACVWTLASSICKQPNFRLKNWSKCMASFNSMPSEVTKTQFCSLLCLGVPFCSAFPVNCFVWCNPCQWNHVAGSQN